MPISTPDREQATPASRSWKIQWGASLRTWMATSNGLLRSSCAISARVRVA
jgi:hypothetical protein